MTAQEHLQQCRTQMAAQDIAGAAGTPASAAGALPSLHIQSDPGHDDGGDLINHFMDFAFVRETHAGRAVLVLEAAKPPDIGGFEFQLSRKSRRQYSPNFAWSG